MGTECENVRKIQTGSNIATITLQTLGRKALPPKQLHVGEQSCDDTTLHKIPRYAPGRSLVLSVCLCPVAKAKNPLPFRLPGMADICCASCEGSFLGLIGCGVV